MLSLPELFWAFQLAGVVYVVTCILTAQDYILERYYDLLITIRDKNRFGSWISKPLGLCEKCTAGQFGLWIWLGFNWPEYLQDFSLAFIRHIIFIAFTILFVVVIKNIFSKWK